MNEFAALSADQACITLKDQGKGASCKGNQCSIYQGNQRPPPLLKLGTMQNSPVVKPQSLEPVCLGSNPGSAIFLGLQPSAD